MDNSKAYVKAKTRDLMARDRLATGIIPFDVLEEDYEFQPAERELLWHRHSMTLLRTQKPIFEQVEAESGIRFLTLRDKDRQASQTSGFGEEVETRQVSLPVFQHYVVFPEHLREQARAEFHPDEQGRAHAGRENEAFLGASYTGIEEAFERLEKAGIVISNPAAERLCDSCWKSMIEDIKQAGRSR